MEQMVEIVQQIHELSGVLLEALQQAGSEGGRGGGGPEGGGPPRGRGGPPGGPPEGGPGGPPEGRRPPREEEEPA